MNNNERILHILDQSTCLTRRQMKDYLAGTMLPEEVHAAEMHISSCPLCSMALDGFEAHSEEALEAIASLNSGFLKDHFDSITPKIHLNSLAPATTFDGRKKKKKSIPLLRVTGIAAALLIGFGTLWFLDYKSKAPTENAIAVHTAAPATSKINTTPPIHTERQKDDNKPVAGDGALAAKSASKKGVAANGDLEAQPVMGAAAPAAPPAAYEQNIAAAPVMKEKAAGVTNDSVSVMTANGVATSEQYSRAASKDAYKPAAMKMSSAAPARKMDDANAFSASEDHLQKGDDLAARNKYSGALAHYNKELNNSDPTRRAQAAIGAAQCYAKLGNKRKAISLLQQVVDQESGQQRRRAKRLLRELESDN